MHLDSDTARQMCFIGDRFSPLFNLKIRYIRRHAASQLILLVYTSLAFTTHKHLLPMWLLYTQLAQFATTVPYNTSTDGIIPVLSSKSLLVVDTSKRALFFVFD